MRVTVEIKDLSGKLTKILALDLENQVNWDAVARILKKLYEVEDIICNRGSRDATEKATGGTQPG